MAYAITQSAPTYANIGNDILFSVYDSVRANDQTTYPDFTYICDVYVDSVLVARLKAIPAPTYFSGTFNIKRVLDSYAPALPSFELPHSSEIDRGQYTIRTDYVLKFGSEYGSTLTTNEIVDSARYVYNSYDKNFIRNGGAALFDSSAGFKTDRPSRISISEDSQVAVIPFYYAATGGTVDIATYNQEGSVVASGTYTPTASAYNMNYSHFSKLNVSGLLSVSGAVGAYLQYGVNRFFFDWKCNPKFTTYTVGFINRYGGMESYDFYLASTSNVSIERKYIETNRYSVSTSGVIEYQGEFNNYGTSKNYSNKVSRKIKLRSDWINDETYIWLEQLIVSPYICIYNFNTNTDGGASQQNWRKVRLANTDYEHKQFVKDGLTILELEFEYDGYSPQRL